MSKKNTGAWIFFSLFGFFVLAGGFTIWRQTQSTKDAATPLDIPVAAPQQVAAQSAMPVEKAANVLVTDISDSTFAKEVEKSSKPVLVDFWATWCGPCRMFGPIVDQVAADYRGRLKVCRVDVDQNPGLSQTFQVRAIPTSLLFKNGKVVKMWVGLVSGADLKVEVDKILKRPKKTKLVES